MFVNPDHETTNINNVLKIKIMKANELQAFNLFIIVGDKSRKIYEFSNICQDGENCKVLDFWQKAHYIDVNTNVIKLSK